MKRSAISAQCKTPVHKKSHLDRLRNQLSQSSTPGSPASKLLHIPASPCLKQLGYGTGVKVYLYERSPRSGGQVRSPWALKKWKRTQSSGKNADIEMRMDEEAKILKTLSHPNIIGYRGYKKLSDGSKVLILENGEKSLLDMIDEIKDEESEPGPFEPEDILFVIEKVAEALDYLHTEHQLLHGDLKSGNILIKKEFEDLKICDFGVTLKLDKAFKVTDKSQTYIGTGPWTAKEVFDANGVVSAKTDIFALGCIIYEMLALETPHIHLLDGSFSDDESEDDDDFEIDEEAYQAALGTRPQLPEHLCLDEDESYKKVLSVFYACTEQDPEKRPTAKMILKSLASK